MIRGAVLVALVTGFLPRAVAAAEPPPPVAQIGAPLPGDVGRASLVRPAVFTAVFRAPRTDTALYVAARYVRDLSVVVVGPGAERRTFVATDDLPGHLLGVQLPADAPAADRLEVRATTVSAQGAPFLLSAEELAEIGWSTWSYDVLFGLFAALAILFGTLALIQRRRLHGWYAAAMAGEAGLLVSYLGIARPSPELGQAITAVSQALVFAGLTGFALAYVRRAHVPRPLAIAVWVLVLIDVAMLAGFDVLQDDWPVSGMVEQWPIAALLLVHVVLGVVAIGSRIEGGRFFLAGTAAAAAGFGASFLPSAQGTPWQDATTYGAGLEALLLGVAIAAVPRGDRARIGSRDDVDGLTGIANRAALDRWLAQHGAARGSRTAAAVLLDVDRFRAYNDTYGHAAGDDALRQVGAVVAQGSTGPGDLGGRYGDNQFLLLLDGADLTSAKRAGAELVAAVAALAIAHGAVPSKRLSVSIGVASVTLGPGDRMELLRRATGALYLAKTLGRNRVVADESAASALSAR